MIRLKKYSVSEKGGWPGPIDIVLYKPEENIILKKLSELKCFILKSQYNEKLYRLRFIHNYPIRDELQGLHMMFCLGKYAPEIIEGKILFENKNEIRVRSNDNIVYEIQKNIEVKK